MKPNMRLVGDARTPQREALAAAIERHAAAVEAVRRVEQGREQAAETVYRASDALKAAEAALAEAQADEGGRLAAKALGEDAGPIATDAEASVKQASNDLNIARRTRDALDERAQREAAEVGRAKEAVEKCIGEVVRSKTDVARLLGEARVAQANLVSRRIVLRHLFNNGLVAEQEQGELRNFLLFENNLPVGRGQVEYGNFDSHPAADAWKAALQELRENADAPLPS